MQRHFDYGWDNGELSMEKVSLTKEEEDSLLRITDIAFREMGERTRIASGDDQFYVNAMYNDLKQNKNMNTLVRIVFMLCKQFHKKT